MAKQSREDLRKNLKQVALAPVYLLHGPEGYLRDSAARAITESAMKDAPLREFNDISFGLLETEIGEALAAAEQMPMLAPLRVVRIADIGKSRSSDQREAEEEAILKYAQRPAPTSVVIFVTDELDKRRKFTKTMIEISYSVEFLALKDDDLQKWAGERFKDLNTTVDRATLNHLVKQVGSDVRTLTNEIDKLATAALPGAVVTAALVDQLVPRSRELSNFELTDQLIAGERGRALGILQRILDDGAEPPMLIGLLASNYHKLAMAKDLTAQGQPVDEVLRAVGWPPFKREGFMSCVRRSEPDRLARSLKLIADADLAIKTSQATPRMQIELLVCDLASRD